VNCGNTDDQGASAEKETKNRWAHPIFSPKTQTADKSVRCNARLNSGRNQPADRIVINATTDYRRTPF
jgi:hypothetical protein